MVSTCGASKDSWGDAFSWHAARIAPPYTRRADPAPIRHRSADADACALISQACPSRPGHESYGGCGVSCLGTVEAGRTGRRLGRQARVAETALVLGAQEDGQVRYADAGASVSVGARLLRRLSYRWQPPVSRISVHREGRRACMFQPVAQTPVKIFRRVPRPRRPGRNQCLSWHQGPPRSTLFG